VTPTNRQPIFDSEDLARQALEELLRPWFHLKAEVWIRYPGTPRTLRIDYLAKPKPGVAFALPLFGVEVKAANERGALNRAVKQAIDYTHCEVSDCRPSLAQVRGTLVRRVYLSPAPPTYRLGDDRHDYVRGWHDGVERVAGLFRVGLIYVRYTGRPQFCMSAERQWDADQGPVARITHMHQRGGSGVIPFGRPA
jgi:hypothetical protein